MNSFSLFWLSKLFNPILTPLGCSTPPWLAMVVSGLVSAGLVLLVYRWLSRPHIVRRLKDRIKASILSMRIYRDFPGVMGKSFIQSLGYTLGYIGMNMIPLLVLFPVLFLLFVQMDVRFGKRSFFIGEELVLKLRYASAMPESPARLIPTSHVRLKMNPVVIPSLREINWKIETIADGFPQIALNSDGAVVKKQLLVGTDCIPVSEKRSSSRLSSLLYPVEPPIPKNLGIESLSIKYPRKRIFFLGLRMSWIFPYLLITILPVLLLKKRMGIEF